MLARDVAGGHAAAAVQQELAKDGIAIDVLVNNAGFGLHGPFVEADWDKQLQMMELNMVGLTAFTRAFGADMASRGHGQILNIASTAAFQPGPFMAVYYATKAYVLSFSEAVASELRDRGVTVTALCPGPTETGFAGAAGLEGNPLFGGRLMGKPMDAVSVARIGLRALDQGEPVVIAGLRNQFMARAGAFLPRKAVTAISRWVVEK